MCSLYLRKINIPKLHLLLSFLDAERPQTTSIESCGGGGILTWPIPTVGGETGGQSSEDVALRVFHRRWTRAALRTFHLELRETGVLTTLSSLHPITSCSQEPLCSSNVVPPWAICTCWSSGLFFPRCPHGLFPGQFKALAQMSTCWWDHPWLFYLRLC